MNVNGGCATLIHPTERTTHTTIQPLANFHQTRISHATLTRRDHLAPRLQPMLLTALHGLLQRLQIVMLKPGLVSSNQQRNNFLRMPSKLAK